MTSNATKPAGDLVVHLRRVLPASREHVYEALTKPDKLARWWGPKGFSCPLIEFDPRVGGSYRIAMQPPDGDPFHLSGEFREVDPPDHLAYSFRWDPPDPDDRETVVALSLRELDGGTELLLTQGDFATQERLALHEGGWTESLERLREVLAGAVGG